MKKYDKDKRIGIKEVVIILLVTVVFCMGALYFIRPDAFDALSEIIKDLSNFGNLGVEIELPKTELKVTFDANGGDVSVSDKDIVYLEKYGDLPAPTKNNAEFLGWYTEKNSGTKVTSSSKVERANDHTLYARWAVTVTFDARGGECNIEKQRFVCGEKYAELPIPTKKNHTFLGWYTLNSLTEGTLITEESLLTNTEHHTLYARWGITVSLDYNDGVSESESKQIVCGDIYGELPRPDRENYTFLGWFTNADGGEKISQSSTAVTCGNHTLYAHWQINTYPVIFNTDGGVMDTESISVSYGFPYGNLPISQKEGASFVGWFTSPSGEAKVNPDTSVNIPSTHTLYARWSFVIEFDANGGEDVDGKEVASGLAYGKLPIPTRENYEFVGWYTLPMGGVKITDEALVENSNPHTLYAHWQGLSYTISFDANDGETTLDPISVVYGSKFGDLPVLSKENAQFLGWFTEPTYGEEITSNTVLQDSDLETLYAHWGITVSFYSEMGDFNSFDLASRMVVYGSTYGELPYPQSYDPLPLDIYSSFDGDYEFVGWFTDPDGGVQVSSDTVVDRLYNHTLYARWKRCQTEV